MIKNLLNMISISGVKFSLRAILAFLLLSNFAKAQYIVDFEAETSVGYASDTVTLNGLDWDLTESLIGNLADDFKNGLKSLRLRGYGTSSFTMLQDKPNGIGTISFLYSEYGTDSQTSWRVEYSTDAGVTWIQVGTDITATGGNAMPSTFSETINVTGNVRIRVVEATGSGASNRRMNIDDITITDYLTITPIITATPALLNGFIQFVGTPSAEQSLEVSGSNLTNDITLTVTSGDYEISETSGAGFTNSITLTQNAGVVAPTTIYVRLNGLVAASPSDGEITLTSSGAIDVIVALSGEILNPLPTVFVSEDTLIGFSHFVGTPSAEQTFDVSGAFLTDDILITAPGEYEVSLTSGSGFSNSLLLTQTAGEVSNTTIYVRLNGLVMNSNQVGDVVISSTGATNELVFVSGETLDYTLSTIAGVSQLDTNNLAESIGFLAELRGIVHCIDFRAGNGYNVTLIDGEGDGIQIFNFNQISNYESTEGDSLIVKGEIGQFNGLLQIVADEITLVSQGNATVSPQIVTQLDENTENQLVTLENLYFSTPTANWPTNGNVDVTNGVLTFTARVVTSSPYSGSVTPSEPFNITGIGGQYDNSSPYDGGYQIFPCMVEELCNLDNSTTTSDLTITASQVGVNYQWIDCATGNSLAGETNQSFTATQNGSYAVILSDGICTDTSECVVISTIGIKELESNFEIYPIPFENQLFLQGNNVKFQIEIYNLEGRLITSLSDINEKLTIDTKTWSKGVYTVIISSGNQMEYRKLIK